MKKRLAHLCTTTTCHGVADWYEAKGIYSKTFWSCVLVTAFMAIGYYQYNLLVTFMSSPTATKISKVMVNYMAFPNITVCNTNAFSMRKLNQTWTTELQPIFQSVLNSSSTATEFLDLLRWTTLSYPTSRTWPSNLTEKEYQVLFNKSFLTHTRKYDILQFMTNIGYACSEIFPLPGDCEFGRIN